MKAEAETVTFQKVVPIADADGVPIREGAVLREINDGTRGVVVRIVRVGDRGTAFDSVGDLNIRLGHGTTRVTNRYNQWRHVPHNEQTHEERYMSWLKIPGTQLSEDMAIDGILSLLPDDAVDWELEGGPTNIEEALKYLARHMDELKGQTP